MESIETRSASSGPVRPACRYPPSSHSSRPGTSYWARLWAASSGMIRVMAHAYGTVASHLPGDWTLRGDPRPAIRRGFLVAVPVSVFLLTDRDRRQRGGRAGRRGGDLRLHRLRRPRPGAGALAALLRPAGRHPGRVRRAHQQPDGADGDPRHGGGGGARRLCGRGLAADGDRRAVCRARLLDCAGPVARAATGGGRARDRHPRRPCSGCLGRGRAVAAGTRSPSPPAGDRRNGREAAGRVRPRRLGIASRAALRRGHGHRGRLPADRLRRPRLLGAADDPLRAQARGRHDDRADRGAPRGRWPGSCWRPRWPRS